MCNEPIPSRAQIIMNNVEVALRIRSSARRRSQDILIPTISGKFSDKTVKLKTSETTERQFLYDYVFDKHTSQEHVFDHVFKFDCC